MAKSLASDLKELIAANSGTTNNSVPIGALSDLLAKHKRAARRKAAKKTAAKRAAKTKATR